MIRVHSRVMVVGQLDHNGLQIPYGSLGTVVSVTRTGLMYEVEIEQPIQALVTASYADIAEPADDDMQHSECGHWNGDRQ